MGQKRADKVRRRKERQLNGQKVRDRAQEFLERQEARRQEAKREADSKVAQEHKELYKRMSLFNEDQRKAMLVDPTMKWDTENRSCNESDTLSHKEVDKLCTDLKESIDKATSDTPMIIVDSVSQSVKPIPKSHGTRRPYMPRGFIGMSSIMALTLMSGMTGMASSKESNSNVPSV